MADARAQLAFCRYWCGDLTEAQTIMVQSCVERGTFLGVGRPIGRSILRPLCLIGRGSVNVIDERGYYELAAVTGRRGWNGKADEQVTG